MNVPPYLENDRYWKPVLWIFRNNDKLITYFTEEYFNFEECEIEVEKLQRKSLKWSRSEKFMLDLALHLFNERNPINLGDMDYCDKDNKGIAVFAIKMRFDL